MGTKSKNTSGLSEEVVVEEPKKEEAKAIEKKPAKSKNESLTKVRVLVPLNVRSAPGISSMVVDVVNAGRVVRIYEEKDGWGRIRNNCWISLSPNYVERV